MRVRQFHVGTGFTLADLKTELDDMIDVLLGRIDPPIDEGIGTLQEVASAYYGRAREIEAHILRCEQEKVVAKGSDEYRFRTGELRAFTELAKNACELGSRRVTKWKVEMEMRTEGLE